MADPETTDTNPVDTKLPQPVIVKILFNPKTIAIIVFCVLILILTLMNWGATEYFHFFSWQLTFPQVAYVYTPMLLFFGFAAGYAASWWQNRKSATEKKKK